MKSVLLTLALFSSFSAFAQTASQHTNLGRKCSNIEKAQIAEAIASLKAEVKNKVEKGEGVHCIGYANDDTRLSCGVIHGSLATLLVKVNYSIEKSCDASTLKTDGYKVKFTHRVYY
jgi:hypothetical protein